MNFYNSSDLTQFLGLQINVHCALSRDEQQPWKAAELGLSLLIEHHPTMMQSRMWFLKQNSHILAGGFRQRES